VILGDAERQIAEEFAEAGKNYGANLIAFHLRAINLLYEGLKEKSTIVIVPSTAVKSMQLGGLAGLTALTMGIAQTPAQQIINIENTPMFVEVPEGIGIGGILHTGYKSTRAKLAALGLSPN
jgi:hypothetical protein